MSQDYNSQTFKNLLQRLQEESWQLELLISGFAIFGLFTVYEPLSIALAESKQDHNSYKTVISLVATVSCAILIFNLILHVLLRGLWIGALGLRYVSGDIDYEKLNYSQKFTSYLKKKVGSFDKYIATLENYCSIIFAISFLLIFYVLAITFTILTIIFIATFIISNDWLPWWISKGIGLPLMLFVCLGMLITFIDFVTLGWLKKYKWISRIYFPVYKVFSFITLSFLYRPIVYNFLDHKFGRRLSLVLVPFYILILVLASFEYQTSNYISNDLDSSDIIANIENYEDQLNDKKQFTGNVSIPSKVITNSYLKVFVLYYETIENSIFDFNPSLKPKEDLRGLYNEATRTSKLSRDNSQDSIRRKYIQTFNSIYSIQIDSMTNDSEFVLTQNFRNELGFETYINLDSLSEGKHLLNVKRTQITGTDTTQIHLSRLPFWYFPN
ncbi:MAG: hypothetical protein WA775_14580 [Psychroserpens sp.]|uniref:hypothetical protein n=1 Tax=Psychroserpens sp. TaxID=2020870 RepID=UPI003CAA1BFF